MASIEGYRSDINEYEDIKDKLYKIIAELDSASQNARHLSRAVASDYRIDNDSAEVVDNIDTLDRSIDSTIDHLRNNVIPEINSEISYARDEIERLEEEERRRREEEEDDDDD